RSISAGCAWNISAATYLGPTPNGLDNLWLASPRARFAMPSVPPATRAMRWKSSTGWSRNLFQNAQTCELRSLIMSKNRVATAGTKNHHQRTETDSLGRVEVPADHLWGAQTQRCLVDFPIAADRFHWGRPVIRALGIVKKCAAQANHE